MSEIMVSQWGRNSLTHLSDMLCALCKLCSFHMWIVVVFALLGNVADGDGVPRAELKSSKALGTICADDGLVVLYLDIASRADACALSAGNAVVINLELFSLLLKNLGKSCVLYGVEDVQAGFSLGLACHYVTGYYSGKVLTSGFCLSN